MAAKRPTPVVDQPTKGQRTNPYKAAKRIKDPQKGQKNPRGVWMGSWAPPRATLAMVTGEDHGHTIANGAYRAPLN